MFSHNSNFIPFNFWCFSGASIWSADPAVTNNKWSYFQPQVIPDLDGDGVFDVVVTHGGNGDYKPEVSV